MTPSEDGCILAVDDVTVIQILCKSHNTSDDNIKHVFHKINYSIHFRVKVKVMALSVTSRCDTWKANGGWDDGSFLPLYWKCWFESENVPKCTN